MVFRLLFKEAHLKIGKRCLLETEMLSKVVFKDEKEIAMTVLFKEKEEELRKSVLLFFSVLLLVVLYLLLLLFLEMLGGKETKVPAHMMMSLYLSYIIALTFRIYDVFISSSLCFQKISADLSHIYNEVICAESFRKVISGYLSADSDLSL